MENAESIEAVELVPVSWDVDVHGNTILAYKDATVILPRTQS